MQDQDIPYWLRVIRMNKLDGAFHEAGHAVAAYVQGFDIGHVTIEAVHGGRWNGGVWYELDVDTPETQAAEILVDLAGAAAVAIWKNCSLAERFSVCNRGDLVDLAAAATKVSELFRALALSDNPDCARLWNKPRPTEVMALLHQHWSKVDAVQQHLMLNGVATGHEVVAVIEGRLSPGGGGCPSLNIKNRIPGFP